MQAPYDQSPLVPFHFAFFPTPSLRIPFSFQIPEVTSNFANTEQKKNVSLGKSEMTHLPHPAPYSPAGCPNTAPSSSLNLGVS